jgi:hypothetical protein
MEINGIVKERIRNFNIYTKVKPLKYKIMVDIKKHHKVTELKK